jgi:hypothetical protein
MVWFRFGKVEEEEELTLVNISTTQRSWRVDASGRRRLSASRHVQQRKMTTQPDDSIVKAFDSISATSGIRPTVHASPTSIFSPTPTLSAAVDSTNYWHSSIKKRMVVSSAAPENPTPLPRKSGGGIIGIPKIPPLYFRVYTWKRYCQRASFARPNRS